MTNSKMITLICECCNKEYTIKVKLYKDRLRKNLPNYCKDCMKKYTSKNHSIYMRKRFEDPKEHEKISKASKAGMDKMDPEAKRKMKENQLIGIHNYFNGLSDTDLHNHTLPLLNYIKTEGEEKKHERYRKISNSSQNTWDKKSEEEIIQFSKNVSRGVLNYYKNESPEDKLFRLSSIKNGMKNMSKEKKMLMRVNQSTNKRKIWNNYEYEDHVLYDQMYCTSHNKNVPILLKKFIDEFLDNLYDTEAEFMKLLLKYNINFLFQIYNLIPYPNFRKLFPYNIQTGKDYVCPFHRWDFLIITTKGNIFIDIDGSIHDPNKNKYYRRTISGNKILMSDIEDFYDSQRIYQTDGLPAYIVQCYDDKLTLDSLVLDIFNTKNILTVKNLIKLISTL